MREPRINNFTAGFMLVVAVTFDGLKILVLLIPFLGELVAPILMLTAWLIFFIWFTIRGVSLAKNFSAMIVGSVICTIMVLRIIAVSRLEDKLATKTTNLSRSQRIKAQVTNRNQTQQGQQVEMATSSARSDFNAMGSNELRGQSADYQRTPLQHLPLKNSPIASNDNIYKKAA